MTMGGMTHDMLMPGMLSDEEMAALDKARGVEFDRLFLVGMIKHHEGAITMVNEVLAANGAVRDDLVFKFTNDIFADQTTEINVMRQMLAALPPARFLELSSETVSANVWQNLSLARYAERMRMELVPVLILAEPPAHGLVAVHERPDTGIERHREYALTWFSLAATGAVLWIVFSFRRQAP